MKDRRHQQDFNREIEAHIAHEADRLVAEGMSQSEAQAAARKTFGNVTIAQERFYESRRLLWWEQLKQDTRYAARSWQKHPWVTAIAIVSLGLGIGANTAIFSVVNTLLIKDLPYRNADRLMYVTEYWPHEPVVPGPPSPDFANWRMRSKLSESVSAYGGGAAMSLTGSGEPERINGTMVTRDLLPVLGTKLALGRSFSEEEDRLGGPPAVILGYNLWQKRFAGSPEVLDKTITLNGVARSIVGVLPAEFRFPDNNFREDLLVPMALPASPDWGGGENFRLLRVLVRTKPGVTASALKQEFSSLLQVTAAQEPAQMVTMRKDLEVRVTPLRDWLTSSVRRTVVLLEATAAILLLIACLNIAGLQTALAISRKKEFALRTALGAGVARLARQLLTETFLLSLLAGGLGIALAHSSLKALRAFLPANLHLADAVDLDRHVFVFTACIIFLCGVCTGLFPALTALGSRINDTLQKGNNRMASDRGQLRLQSCLVVVEVAAATVLLVGSGLLIRTFIGLATSNPGFDPGGVLTLKIAPSPRKYPKRETRVAFYQQLLQRGRAIPGVEFAAIGGGLPLIGTLGAAGVSFQGRPPVPVGGRPSIPVAFVSPDYFRAIGIPLLRGRAFSEADRQHAPLVAIVNQAFADKYFPGEDPVGKRIEVASREGHWREIVGIAGNVKQQGQRPVDPFIVYGPLAESFEFETFLILKSAQPPKQLAAAAAKAVHSVDPNEPVFDVASMDDRLGEALSRPRSVMTLMTGLAGLALVLVTLGIFGMTAYFVNRRRHEIGVRMALGATRTRVFKMILRRAMLMVGAGIGLGTCSAFALFRSISSRVEGLPKTDPATLLAVAVGFSLVALVACLIPARSATTLDPLVVLRQDS